jgi:hypothetical protein
MSENLNGIDPKLLERYEKELKHKWGNWYNGEWSPDFLEIALLKESGEWETLTPWIQRQIIQENTFSNESMEWLQSLDDLLDATWNEIEKEELAAKSNK